MRFVPIIIALALAIFLGLGLQHSKEGEKKLDDKHIGQVFPDFSIKMLGSDKEKLTPQIFAGNIAIVNVFASWCEGCIAEHEALMNLAKSGKVALYGLAWKDTPEKISAYLEKHGNPFLSVGVDNAGDTTLALALTGIPETFVIDKNGKIALHYKSAITGEFIDGTLLPLIEKLNSEPARNEKPD